MAGFFKFVINNLTGHNGLNKFYGICWIIGNIFLVNSYFEYNGERGFSTVDYFGIIGLAISFLYAYGRTFECLVIDMLSSFSKIMKIKFMNLNN